MQRVYYRTRDNTKIITPAYWTCEHIQDVRLLFTHTEAAQTPKLWATKTTTCYRYNVLQLGRKWPIRFEEVVGNKLKWWSERSHRDNVPNELAGTMERSSTPLFEAVEPRRWHLGRPLWIVPIHRHANNPTSPFNKYETPKTFCFISPFFFSLHPPFHSSSSFAIPSYSFYVSQRVR